MKIIHYIAFFMFLFSGINSLSQDDFDVDEYLQSEEFKEKYGEDEVEETTVFTNKSEYETYDIQEEYLNSKIKKEEFDWLEWQKIKRSIVDGIPESEYTVSEDGYVLEDEDNPFQKSRNQNRNHWSKKRDDNLHQLKRLPEEERKREKERKNYKGFSFSTGFGQFLLILIVIALAVLIFYMFFKNQINSGDKKISYDLENISPTQIPKSELELLLEKSLANEDWREAIRIYFVFTIKSLVEKNWITWEKEKTNFSYLIEMRENKNFKEFEEVVSIYEIIWYGEREINKKEFKSIEPKFVNLLEKLGK